MAPMANQELSVTFPKAQEGFGAPVCFVDTETTSLHPTEGEIHEEAFAAAYKAYRLALHVVYKVYRETLHAAFKARDEVLHAARKALTEAVAEGRKLP